MIRLRQVALAARHLDRTVDALCSEFGLTVCYRDPGVATFGLVNALMTIGDQFLEVVAPAQEGTTAGRLLDKRCPGDPAGVTGYMAIYQVDDLDVRDVGGAIVSIDEPTPPESWTWAGADWQAHGDTSVVTAIAGVTVRATDPAAMHARWRDLGVDHAVRFEPAGDGPEGIDELELVAADRARAGEVRRLGQLTIRLV
jgi:hypothetical protein